MTRLILFAITAIIFLSARAGERSYSFNFNGEDVSYYGTARKEICDVAVCLDAPALAGFSIKGISVPLPGNSDSYESASAFLTKELNVELIDGLRVNVPDICSVDATIENGILTATFSDPYVLTGEPVYVGYSFSITDLTDATKAPLAVVAGNNPDGLWFHSNRTSLKWTNYVDKKEGGIQSAMDIVLDGDFQIASASVELPYRCVFQTGEEEPVYGFTVFNYGYDDISSIKCEWSVGDESGYSVYVFPEPINNTLGSKAKAFISLPSIDAQGHYPLSVRISEVNDRQNTNGLSSSESRVIYSDVIPMHLPLIEEYTGLWCGNCPRGYAALEWMKEKYGYEFVAASWHNSDPMSITTSYPSDVRGFPTSWIDRNANMDPSAIPAQWEHYRAIDTDFAMSCSTEFSSDSHSTLTAKTDIISIEDLNSTLSIGYLLIADGLTDPSWTQTNYFSGEVSPDIVGEWAEFFADAPQKVKGLIFNDVVINASKALGVPNSIPSSLQAFTTYSHEVSFNLDGITNDSRGLINIDPSKVRVLAFILDDKGNILNSCSSAYPGEKAPDLSAGYIESEPTDSEWYDLQGNRISAPSGSIFIRVDTFADGSRKATKVLVP